MILLCMLGLVVWWCVWQCWSDRSAPPQSHTGRQIYIVETDAGEGITSVMSNLQLDKSVKFQSLYYGLMGGVPF
jgi:hypothetical protein